MSSSYSLQKKDWRHIFSVASIMSLRMIGLFMVLPVFAVYANHLPNSSPFLVGTAMGIYGLTQALFQFPFGMLSDYIGRKTVIFFGLLFFICGSLIAAYTQNIYVLILGRALQGVGAIGSSTLALLSDTVEEEKRGTAMAIVGACIGLSFMLSMWLGPLLSSWFNVNGLFLCAAIFGSFAILILLTQFPSQQLRFSPVEKPCLKKALTEILTQREILQLIIGVFFLHSIFTASFMAIPFSILDLSMPLHSEWKLYLPSLIIAMLISLFVIRFAEKNHCVKFFFLSAIFLIFISELFFALNLQSKTQAVIYLSLFFTGFTFLEALQPALVSRFAPHHLRGSALGLYSFMQFFGIFIGGIFGGWLKGHTHNAYIYFSMMMIALIWFFMSYHLPSPPARRVRH